MKLRLIPITTELQQNIDRPDAFAQQYGARATIEALDQLRERVKQSLEFYAKIGATDPWIGYIVVLHDPANVVGCCGFKGNPDERGAVEISYHTLPQYEGRGYGTAIANEMFNQARNCGAALVIAHTMPEPNASGRLLEKNGFQLIGPAEDPEDGTVWRWEKKT